MLEASLTPIEERILVALYRSSQHFLLSDEIVKEARIAMSTLAAEQKRLVALGLLEKTTRRFILDDKISRRTAYELTTKGEIIAIHLAHVSSLLSENAPILCEEHVITMKNMNSASTISTVF
jgi:DNA-binding MarR family transcriptional regulator